LVLFTKNRNRSGENEVPNYDGLYEVRITYETVPSGFPALEHTLTFDVEPTATPEVGEAFSAITVAVRSGSPEPLSDKVDDFVAGLIAIYPATATIIRAELWYIPEGTFAGTFISTYPIDEVGVNGTGSQVAQQTTLTFRSIAGGNGRIQLMECSLGGNNKESYPYTSASLNAIADLVTNTAGFILARDNSFMFANIHASHGQNERLWRKRYRA
jgi:hypothetical protein